MLTLKLVVVVLGVFLGKFTLVRLQSSPCEFDDFKRIGQTRFFVLHNPNREKTVNFKNALALCKKKGLKMATLNSITQFASLARALERFVNFYKLQDTWYWLDATYFPNDEIYKWNDGKTIEFTNFFYRQPRPTGVGAHVKWNGTYEPEREDAMQCLTLALPLPGIGDKNRTDVYGHSTTIDEKYCGAHEKRHAICETENPQCFAKVDDFFELSVDPFKQNYFDDGNWIFGDRKYIVNWRMRNVNDSRAYCEKYGLVLYDPTLYGDTCLIPFIKMWSRNITVTNFWSDWSYEKKSGNFMNSKGEKVTSGVAMLGNWTEATDLSSRSNKKNELFCVSMVHSYEFRAQMPCPTKDPSVCVWNFINFVPSNCNNVQATICQHKNHTERKCPWKAEYIKNVTLALNETALVPFGYKTNSATFRSTYKQAFGSLLCRQGSQMARRNSTFHKFFPSNHSIPMHMYDYNETYWVVDDEGFHKDSTSMCTVSFQKDPVKNVRDLKKVPCLSWHFYLCEVFSQPVLKGNFTKPGNTDWKWNDNPTPRYYPVINK